MGVLTNKVSGSLDYIFTTSSQNLAEFPNLLRLINQT
jgi:hypothetical protein